MNLLVALFALTPSVSDLAEDACLRTGLIPARVGRIIVEGNTVTDERVFFAVIGFSTGDVLQYPKLEEGRKNLIRLGIFDEDYPPIVEVIPGKFGGVSRDIRVWVKETPAGFIAIGANVNNSASISK